MDGDGIFRTIALNQASETKRPTCGELDAKEIVFGTIAC